MNAVADTSPLIHFAAAGILPALAGVLGRVHVPPVVRDELVVLKPEAPEVRALHGALVTWLQVVELTPLGQAEAARLGRDVDVGEAGVIALALQLDADLVVMDDQAGRRAARRRGLQVIGTAGLLVEAKKAGLVPAVAPFMAIMRDHGLWISDDLVAEVLARAGEG